MLRSLVGSEMCIRDRGRHHQQQNQVVRTKQTGAKSSATKSGRANQADRSDIISNKIIRCEQSSTSFGHRAIQHRKAKQQKPKTNKQREQKAGKPRQAQAPSRTEATSRTETQSQSSEAKQQTAEKRPRSRNKHAVVGTARNTSRPSKKDQKQDVCRRRWWSC